MNPIITILTILGVAAVAIWMIERITAERK